MASLHDVEVKIEFATDQLHALDVEFDNLRESGEYQYSVEIRRGGLHHVYRAVDSPPAGRYWGTQIGSVAHALRSALEHLAWQLVIANDGSPSNTTHFPILRRAPTDGPLRIRGGIAKEAMDIVEAVQPYNGANDGKKLAAIHDLDVFDKHRELVVTTATVHQASTHGPSPLPENSIVFTKRPMTHDNVVAIVKYVEPQLDADSNLSFTPYMTLGFGAPYRDEIVTGFMWELLGFVQDDFVPRFHQWVPPASRPVNMPTRPRHPR